jgi:hypothetical protein
VLALLEIVIAARMASKRATLRLTARELRGTALRAARIVVRTACAA